jgi:hypothetical protein
MHELSSPTNADLSPTTSSFADDTVTVPIASCPRCGGRVTDPGGISWCPSCGHCPLLEKQAEQVPDQPAPRAPSKLGAVEFFSVVGRTPGWLWLLLLGVFSVIGVSLTVGFILPHESIDRVRWSLGQLLFGVVVVVAAHLWAMRQVPAVEVRGRSRGTYSLVELWRSAASRMPATRWPINLLSWGVSLIVCALLVIGGFSWWVLNAKIAADRPKTVQQAR